MMAFNDSHKQGIVSAIVYGQVEISGRMLRSGDPHNVAA